MGENQVNEMEYRREQEIIEGMRTEIKKLQMCVLTMVQQTGVELPPEKYPFLYQ